MAKPNKSGLGRGLSSLLGDSYESARPAQPHKAAPRSEEKKIESGSAKASVPSQQRERVVVELGEIDEYDPILEPRTIQSRDAVMPLEGVKGENPSKPPTSVAKTSPAVSNQRPEGVMKGVPVEQARVVSRASQDANEMDITKIKPNPDQPRTNFKEEDLEELASSIKKDGLLQPIIVREVADGTYQIIAGERRWQASQRAGLKKVPVIIKEADNDKALELALIENIQRSDLNPIEEAYGYRRLMERKGMTQAEVAQAVSKGRSTVANLLRLLDLPEEAQRMLFDGEITEGHARAILSIKNEVAQEKLIEKLKEQRLTVRETEQLARLFSGKEMSSDQPSPRQPLPTAYKKVAKALRDVLQTNVRIKSAKGKNKIEIEFTDEDDLRRIFDEIA
ncbi:ParB/RepB/Spo0J family partition protein [Parvibacter caecicola]|uniref:ParB/RepB/Spo0J family partition protein n=1 Tax=Parvibacter caecicola TaxID=747645 RepID=UPI00248CA2D1|nr:ParB/RepB/Spo0J family partition protein [Parvibacter caecicola]